ncbi:MAG: hypothetical protein OXC44_02555 [Proteobacteria bacterium]|nr:hypothetical protein [Pseudomonadota bacterium]
MSPYSWWIACGVAVVCLGVVLYPLVFSHRYTVSCSELTDIEDHKHVILGRYLQAERAYLNGELSQEEWLSKKQSLQRDYIHLYTLSLSYTSTSEHASSTST